MNTCTRRRFPWLLLIALVFTLAASVGCAEIILGDDNDQNDDGSVTGPSGTGDGNGNGTTPIHDDYPIEYRVTGTATQVVVRARHPDDGFNQVTTGLPFSATVLTDAETVFVSLEATAISFVGTPYLNAQIFVDGVLFREAFTTQIGTTVQVTATYRKPEN